MLVSCATGKREPGMISIRNILLITFLCRLLSGCAAYSVPESNSSEVAFTERCENLGRSGQFHQTTVRSTRLLSPDQNSGAPEICEIVASISVNAASTIGVVYRFPSDWNQKIVGLGGGGFAGNVRLDASLPALIQGYATMQTDTGHSATEPWNTEWAVRDDGSTNVEGLIDFGHRSVHEMTVLGKTMADVYYGGAPKRSYFQGCSQGGRQGMVASQMYPQDFDGIISGAPAFNDVSRVSMSLISRAFLPEAAKLSASQISQVNAAALAACDGLDGVGDGIISNPDACSWDPEELVCQGGGEAGACLSASQVAAVRSAYSDKRDPDGDVAAFGLARGSELSSFPWFMALKQDSQLETGYQNFASAAGFPTDTDFNTNDVIASHEAQKGSLFDQLYVADNPDLSEFVKEGGKLILWHGLYDQLLPPEPLIAYYQDMMRVTSETLAAESGLVGKVEDSVQLFTAVGVSHCLGGAGPSTFDGLAVLDAWVEQDAKPTRIVATQPPPAMAAMISSMMGELPRQTPDTMTRPLCPWPSLPQYIGEGRIEDAQNFECR